MVLDFETYLLNEASIKTLKKTIHGALGHTSRSMMKKLLRKYIVHFKFEKKDGSIRRAVGTLISSYLPALRGGAPKPEHQMVYYDLEKEHWRSFRSYSFINIIKIEGEDLKKKKKVSIPTKKELHKKEEEKEKEKHVEKEHDEKKVEKEDIKKKEYKVGEKIPEKELMRRSTDFRKDSRKNKFTKKSNDAKKKGELDDDEDEEKLEK